MEAPSARGEALRRGGAGEARADHDRAALGPLGRRRSSTPRRPARRVARGQHVALAPKTGAQLARKAGGRERVAHGARAGVGGERRSGMREPRERFGDGAGPHVGIARGAEAVEVTGVSGKPERRQHPGCIADGERQRDCAVLEFEPVQAGERQGPGALQLAGERRELGIALVQGGEPFLRERVLFHGNEVEPPRPRGCGAPRVPRREEVQAEAEAQLDDGEYALPDPARGEIVPAQEHVPCLAGAGIGAVVHVAVFRRVRRAVRIERRRRGRYRKNLFSHGNTCPGHFSRCFILAAPPSSALSPCQYRGNSGLSPFYLPSDSVAGCFDNTSETKRARPGHPTDTHAP